LSPSTHQAVITPSGIETGGSFREARSRRVRPAAGRKGGYSFEEELWDVSERFRLSGGRVVVRRSRCGESDFNDEGGIMY